MKSRWHKYKMSICCRVTNPHSILFHVVGIACIIWFVLRVLPAPHRARYPCQQISITVALSYIAFWGILWSALYHGLALWIRKVKTKKVAFTPVILVSFILIFSIISIVYADSYFDEKNEITRWGPIPKEPIGIPQGYNPGRVIWEWNPNATEKELIGYWWEKENNNQTIIDQMFSFGLKTLADANNDHSAWDLLFKHFNQEHGHGNVGYQAGEKIAIKINLNNCNYYTSEDNERDASPYVVKALLRQLVNTVNVDQEDIYIYDASRPMENWFFNRVFYEEYPADPLVPEFADVHYVDGSGDASGREKVESSTERIYFAAGSCSYRTLPTCVSEADYLINIPILKRHPINTGITLAGKNFFGTWIEDVSPIHSYHESGQILGNPAPQTDLFAHKHLGGKTLLYVGDGLYATKEDHYTIAKFEMYPFNNDWTNSLFFSQDPVAIDSVMYDFLHAEGTNPSEGSQNYLHQSAEPPTGVYDPENDGVYLSDGLGVHEHWDISFDIFSSDRYSGPDENGIDYIGEIPENIPPTANIGGSYSGYVTEEIIFDASGSTDSDGIVTGYRWDFDSDGVYDTSWLSSSLTTYIYTVTGTYNVILQVRDNYGAKDIDTTTVTVSEQKDGNKDGGSGTPPQPPPLPPNNDPVADANGPYYGFEDIPITFDASGSNDPDGDIVTFNWDFGDGYSGEYVTTTHIYSDLGNYTVTLTITDNRGATASDSTIAIITGKPNIPPNKPKVNGTTIGHKGINYNYSVITIDPDNDSIRYVFNWSDGTNTTTGYVSNNTIVTEWHNWTEYGNYVLKVYAMDINNATSETVKLTVLIAIRYLNNIGYLIDTNDTLDYDVFYSNITGNITAVERYIEGINEYYRIDVDGDGVWDYVYNYQTGLTTYQKEEDRIPGFECIFTVLAIALVFIWKRKR